MRSVPLRTTSLASALLVYGLTGQAYARVSWFRAVKVAEHVQTSGAPPAAASAWRFLAQVYDLPAREMLAGSVTHSGGTSPLPLTQLDANAPWLWSFRSGTYAVKAEFDAAFPNGPYDFAATLNSGPASGSVTMPGEYFPLSIPALTAASYAVLQNLTPGPTIQLEFTPFTPHPQTPLSSTSLVLFNLTSGQISLINATFNTSFMRVGHNYRLLMTHSDAIRTFDAGFGGAYADAQWANETSVYFTTIPTASAWTAFGLALPGVTFRRRR